MGIVSSKTPEMESKDSLKSRIQEAAKYIDLDQLCLSPQCGFASTVAGNPVTVDVEKAKLSLIVETAAEFGVRGRRCLNTDTSTFYMRSRKGSPN